MKWSILILSIPERLDKLGVLLKKLERQIKEANFPEIELLVLTDNKKRSIASKRNSLLSLAEGDYISFLDDDDTVESDYIESVYEILQKENSYDCITFDQHCLLDNKPLHVSFGLGNPHEGLSLNVDGSYNPIKRPPYHMCIFKRSIASITQFREVWSNDGQSIEDIDWLLRLYPSLGSEYHIEKVLHNYIYNSETTASRK